MGKVTARAPAAGIGTALWLVLAILGAVALCFLAVEHERPVRVRLRLSGSQAVLALVVHPRESASPAAPDP